MNELRLLPSVDTAFVNSSKGWQYCDDSKITRVQDKDVIVSCSPAKVVLLDPVADAPT